MSDMGALSLEKVDYALHPLIDGLSLALTHRCPVIIHTLWHPIPYTALLPFHLHLRWPGKINELPLTTSCSIVPFLNADARLVQSPLYNAHDANKMRLQARHYRDVSKSDFEGDFVHPDWEEGFRKHRTTLQERSLPGCSFLSVDTVGAEGCITRGHRPYLGSRATRKAPRPHVLVPAHGSLSHKAYALLASTDLLLMNLQGIRGQNVLATVREVLEARGGNLPSLIICSSPNDLSSIAWAELNINALDYIFGSAPQLDKIEITIIGKDRPQAERDFDFAVTEIRGYSPLVDGLTKLVSAAWWSGRQNLVVGNVEDLALRRFRQALDRAQLEAPSEARLLTAAISLLMKTFEDNELAQERLKAVLEAIFAVPIKRQALALTKHSWAANYLRTVIAEFVGVTPEQILEAGIDCYGISSPLPDNSYEYAIICGYFGPSTIDAIFICRAPKVHLVLDPVEAGIAWHHIRKMIEQMREAKSQEAAKVLDLLSSALYPHCLPFMDMVSIHVEDKQLTLPSPTRIPLPVLNERNAKESVIILFIDGTWLEVARTARLEIIDRQGAVRLRTVLPTDLQPGDEMILVASDTRSLFSEYLMQTLDSGRLRLLAEKRNTWFTLLNTFVKEMHPNFRAIHRRFSEKGIQVSYQTLLSWTHSTMEGYQTAPSRWQYFRALTEELQISLPESYLMDLFNAIRQWRVRHRLAGRNLVRAMRNAYLGRLDSVTLAKIEREWGLNARELMQSTRLMEVDSVIL